MALARTAIALLPIFLKARARRPGKRLAGVIFSIGFMALSGIFLIAAGFVWIMKNFGAEFGFLAVGLILFVIANIIYFASRGPRVKPSDVEAQLAGDPLSQYIPAELQNDPRVLALKEKITEHPMGSTAAAVSLGFIISTHILGD